MPGNIVSAAPSAVMPESLCLSFIEVREFAQLQNDYHDGTIQRAQLAQSSRRTFRPNMRLDATNLAALYTFLTTQNFGMTPFLFYNPFDVLSGQQIAATTTPPGTTHKAA